MAVLGQITLNEILLIEVDAAPNVSPVDAPIGSIAIMTDGSGIYQKTGPSNIDWTNVFALNLPIPADQVSYSTMVAFFTGVSNVKDALDLIGLNKANLYGGNLFTHDQRFQHPNNVGAYFDIRPGYFSGQNGVFLNFPRTNSPFVLGYLNPSNVVVPVLGRASYSGEVIPNSVTNDSLLLSQDRVVIGATNPSSYVQINSAGLGVGFISNDQDLSAALEIRTPNKGFLPPKLNESQIASIPSPTHGLTVYNINRRTLSTYVNGTTTSFWRFTQYYFVVTNNVTNSTSYLNVIVNSNNGLFPGLYRFKCIVRYSSSSTAAGIGLRLNMVSPGSIGTYNILWSFTTGATNGATNFVWHRYQLNNTDNYVSPTSNSTTSNIAIGEGFIIVSQEGTPVLQFRSSSTTYTVTIFSDSFFMFERIA